MPTWQQLRDVKLWEYEDEADGWGRVSSSANSAKDRVDNEMLGKIMDTQKGLTAGKAIADLQQLSRNYQYLHTECGLIRTALNGLAAELTGTQGKLKRVLAEVPKTFTVNPDGSVEYPVSPMALAPPASGAGTATPGAPIPLLPGKAEGGSDPNKALAEQIAEDIAAAVREANEIDSRYAGVLRKLKTTAGLTVDEKTLMDAAQDTKAVQKAAGKYADDAKIPKGKSPEENAEWWKGLPQEKRDEYATLYPASIGALDGIPSAVRDDANRMVFAETKAKYQLELNAIPAEPSPKLVSYGARGGMVYSEKWLEWKEKYNDRKEHLQSVMKGMDAVQARFDRTGVNGLPEAYLLGFDPESRGDGKVIIANGNPDTADHTAVYVPGTYSDLPTIGGEDGDETNGDLGRSERLWAQSNRLAPSQSISTITWFDYNAPDNITPQATRGSYAEEGGPVLHQFMDGLETAQGGADKSHTTVIGHSYGSTVVGVATQSGSWKDGPMTDDILVAGSPGMQVDHAADLGVRPNHVWAMGAPYSDDSVVRQGGRFMGLGDNWTIPTDESFGGNIMKNDSADHGGFWDEDSQSLRNQAAVVTGQYGKVDFE